MTPSGSTNPADWDWLLCWWKRRVHVLPTAWAWPSGGTYPFRDSSVKGGSWSPWVTMCLWRGQERETLVTQFCRVAHGTWGRSGCTLEGCGSTFSSTASRAWGQAVQPPLLRLSHIHPRKWLRYFIPKAYLCQVNKSPKLPQKCWVGGRERLPLVSSETSWLLLAGSRCQLWVSPDLCRP